ncbi:MAG: hypothetical protein ABJF07_03910 [Nisaea sp.]|uniref:hypothetical protein n=1 Tax=Nisaea sp. TaxID=2024842 RepID=UPI00326740F6
MARYICTNIKHCLFFDRMVTDLHIATLSGRQLRILLGNSSPRHGDAAAQLCTLQALAKPAKFRGIQTYMKEPEERGSRLLREEIDKMPRNINE